MKTEKQFVNTLQDIIRIRGAPSQLISDSAQVEISNKVKDILRYLFIQDWQSEAFHQHQNYAERTYQTIKRTANHLLDRTGSPPSLWLLALKYSAVLHNHTATASLGFKVPLSILTGVTPDISKFLRFHWYERVLFRETEPSFPSESPEPSGRFVGFSANVGHQLTYAILTDDTQKVIYRSEVRTAENPSDPNLRSTDWGDATRNHKIIRSRHDDNTDSTEGINKGIASIDVDDLIGCIFETTMLK